MKYICPDKAAYKKKSANIDADGNETTTPVRGKAKYAGGLVLEPKKGLYDTFILLLDFNSLYPSIIQEFNLCHTTLPEWGISAKEMQNDADVSATNAMASLTGAGDESAPVSKDGDRSGRSGLPAIPDETVERGVLPRVISTIVGRRKTVKQMIKRETDETKKIELDLKQKALKLTANSM